MAAVRWWRLPRAPVSRRLACTGVCARGRCDGGSTPPRPERPSPRPPPPPEPPHTPAGGNRRRRAGSPAVGGGRGGRDTVAPPGRAVRQGRGTRTRGEHARNARWGARARPGDSQRLRLRDGTRRATGVGREAGDDDVQHNGGAHCEPKMAGRGTGARPSRRAHLRTELGERANAGGGVGARHWGGPKRALGGRLGRVEGHALGTVAWGAPLRSRAPPSPPA